MGGVIEQLKSLPRALIFSAAFVFMGLTALAGLKTPEEIRFSFFYLIPISLVSWLVGRRAGVMIAAGSAATWLVVSAAEAGRNLAYEPTLYMNVLLLASFFVAAALVVSALRAALDRERALSRTDPLTGLGNRRAFEERAELEIQRAARFHRPLTLAFLDVDDFKAINDRLGHAAGDRVLALLATALRSHLRSVDLVSRFGGDEFVALLPETDVAAATAVVDKLLKRSRDDLAEKGIAVGISAGVVTFGSAPDSVSAMIRAADDLMYRVKLSGGNQVEFRLASVSASGPNVSSA